MGYTCACPQGTRFVEGSSTECDAGKIICETGNENRGVLLSECKYLIESDIWRDDLADTAGVFKSGHLAFILII